ncbi:MAG: hypothetical protein A2469_03545 [Candidatus Magasanikbacteria bacterium RIFOXYC2_FULL_40_16]|uniref:Uncharacterized protein n=1 Tax=Candidatus Magasanikbacteria bacterium RIFOXYC2_FULL_40_16 TaxID=1798703 RepID=A0A1F6P2I3_9BACT|nr:MAG: hypothetical protein A2469_03545 [Candidatus Magasanikbacteria bacterium RIFOXYC2_FULL_40_16]
MISLFLPVSFFCLYQMLGRIGLDKLGGLPENGWQNCPFTFDEIAGALRFFLITDDRMEAAIEYCLESKMLKKSSGCYYMTVAGLGQYVRACLEEQ